MEEAVVTIQTKEYLYTPVLADGIFLERPRAGAPGKLSFRVVKDDIISFHEGDHVLFSLGEEILFSGFVFSKRRQFGGVITVTAYDQLRYLKNRDIYVYEKLTATELIEQVTEDWGLSRGELQDSGYVIPGRIENGKPLLDIIQTALDITAEQTGELFVLYDNAGQIQLSHVGDMLLDTLIHEGSIGNFDYSSSIDRGSYTAVRLFRSDGERGETVFYGAQEDDLIQKWGMLRHFAPLGEMLDGPETAQNILEKHGKKTRRLFVREAVGDKRVRGGALLPVQLYLGDMVAEEFLMVERVIHRFSESGHTMDLTLVGGAFVD